MHLEQQAGFDVNRPGVILEMGFVGRSHLAQFHPARFHHLGDAKRPADLDHLPPGNDGLFSLRQGGQGEQHRAGVVVDHRRRLGAGQAAEQLFDMGEAMAALARRQIEFEVGIGAADGGDRRQRRFAQGGAAEIGVQQRAGGVDYRSQGGFLLVLGAAGGLFGNGINGQLGRGATVEDGPAQLGDRLLGRFHQQHMGAGRSQGLHGGSAENAVDGGELTQKEVFIVHGGLVAGLESSGIRADLPILTQPYLSESHFSHP